MPHAETRRRIGIAKKDIKMIGTWMIVNQCISKNLNSKRYVGLEPNCGLPIDKALHPEVIFVSWRYKQQEGAGYSQCHICSRYFQWLSCNMMSYWTIDAKLIIPILVEFDAKHKNSNLCFIINAQLKLL